MTRITLVSNTAGVGNLTIASPALSTNRTLIMPDADGNFVVDTALQTLTNKTLAAPTINGSNISDATIQGGIISDATIQGGIISDATIQGGVISGTPVQGGVITALTQIASTSGTSIQYTGIPSWVKRITFLMQSVSMNASTNIQIQIGTSAGFATSGYLGAVGGANFTTGFGVAGSAAGTTVIHGMMTIMNLSGNLWVASMNGGFSSSTGSATGGGSVNLAAVLDRVRLTTVSGTAVFDSGSVNVMLEG